MFQDKNKNLIDIIDEDPDVVAYHDKKEVGRIQFDWRDEGMILWHMDVNPQYQRAGIAFEMMKCAVNIHGKHFGKPSFLSTGGECYEYYTQEGSSFIRYCIRVGLLEDSDRNEEDSFHYE